MQKRVTFLLCLLMAACSSTNNSRYALKQDIAPDRVPTEQEMIDPIPKHLTPSRGGNKDYRVLGKDYQVMQSADGFVERGIASWYGRKFHGHLTSNGEIYDMFAMTAAHKNLPLPTYVEVVNLDNGRKAIVRVNDRGPFHPGRIIDLSYSAATKLGVTQSGTANVEIRALATQAGGFITLEQADDRTKLEQAAVAFNLLYQLPTQIRQTADNYQLLVGPFSQEQELQQKIEQFQNSGYPAKRYIEQ
ncbi:septal ring lytic transglycosylase RlpA family protein [Catenovulum sp. SM1970]|uniref:septal ring lytic transglycosylase RlpA family protein n=1 Tax=Marinifaba aquimaris TaxID=2741323 RepID=UPI00157266FC|nr:septal ring lytic transglycosylase RlpA family protein [Marinifaba aquimaris]NTS75743.1 septal ring lytic transglycosylase RlpA family protein [Marinifaba aquimaris]